MNVLLIYPRYPDTFWSFRDALKFISKKAAFPPLGLITIASMLPKSWDLKLIDLNVEKLKDKHIKNADLVMISAMMIQSKSAREVIAKCKEYGVKVAAGGPAFTSEPEKFKDVDYLILDEGELTIPKFLEDFKNGAQKGIYRSEQKPDITKTPLPSWHLIDISKYASMCIQYSRGCPFNCEFCDIITLFGRKPRTKTPEQMVQELEALYNIGWRGGVFIVDDNFIGNKHKVKKMLHEVIKWQKKHNYPFTFFTEASVNLADDEELMDLMCAANFNKVFLGIESPSLDSLKECNKLQNTKKDLTEVVDTIHRHGMQVMSGFIVGFDSDDESIFSKQIRFIQETGIVTAMVGMLVAAPKTRLYYRLKAENRLFRDPIGDNTSADINFYPKMGLEKLIQGYDNIIKTIYSPKNYYKRIDVFLKNYNPKTKVKLKKEDLIAFIKSIFKIGIFSKSNIYYWKLLFKTLFTRFKSIPVAVELAILGEHFRKFSKKCEHSLQDFLNEVKNKNQLASS